MKTKSRPIELNAPAYGVVLAALRKARAATVQPEINATLLLANAFLEGRWPETAIH
jgi:hypothetical protein